MKYEKNKMLTIGQFAAMHGINKKTLMWYDEIGLFSPAAVSPHNGYRYYSYHQSSVLETILLLRELDVSVSEIQDFMKNRSARSLKHLLDEKITELDRHISHLQELRNTMSHHRQNMTTLLQMDLSEITFVEKEPCPLITVDISRQVSFEEEVELITAETQKYHLRRLHDASYGSMLPAEHLYQGKFEEYSSLFVELPFPLPEEGFHIRPGGKYLRAFFRGNWEHLPEKYGEILDFAREKGLTLLGHSYETGINETVIDRMEDYIVQIEIPVQHTALLQEKQTNFQPPFRPYDS